MATAARAAASKKGQGAPLTKITSPSTPSCAPYVAVRRAGRRRARRDTAARTDRRTGRSPRANTERMADAPGARPALLAGRTGR